MMMSGILFVFMSNLPSLTVKFCINSTIKGIFAQTDTSGRLLFVLSNRVSSGQHICKNSVDCKRLHNLPIYFRIERVHGSDQAIGHNSQQSIGVAGLLHPLQLEATPRAWSGQVDGPLLRPGGLARIGSCYSFQGRLNVMAHYSNYLQSYR